MWNGLGWGWIGLSAVTMDVPIECRTVVCTRLAPRQEGVTADVCVGAHDMDITETIDGVTLPRFCFAFHGALRPVPSVVSARYGAAEGSGCPAECRT